MYPHGRLCVLQVALAHAPPLRTPLTGGQGLSEASWILAPSASPQVCWSHFSHLEATLRFGQGWLGGSHSHWPLSHPCGRQDGTLGQ